MFPVGHWFQEAKNRYSEILGESLGVHPHLFFLFIYIFVFYNAYLFYLIFYVKIIEKQQTKLLEGQRVRSSENG